MIVQELFSVLGLQIDKESWSKGDKFMNAVKTGFTALVAGLSVHAIHGMIEGVAELADEAGKTAQKLGITTEAVQELGYAAKLSDVSQEELNMSLFRFSRQLQDVDKAGSPVRDTLKALGVSAKDLKGESLDQNLEVIADAFAKMPDGPKKAALAMDLFGKSGTRLIPLLNSGKEGIVDLRNEAAELGIVVDTETAKKFEEFNDQQTKLSETWRGIKTQVVTALLPSLMHIVEAVQEWIDTNRELIASGLGAVITAATFAFQLLAKAVDVAIEAIKFLTDGSDEANAVLIGIALVIANTVVPAVWSMVAGWVAAAAPIIAIVLALSAVAYGIIKLVKNWDKVKAAGAAALDWVYKKLEALGNFILSLPGKILGAFEKLGEGIVQSFVNAFDYIIDKAKEFASDLWSEIKDIPVIGRIAAGAEAVVGSGSAPGIDAALEAVGNSPNVIPPPPTAGGSVDLGDINMTVNAAPGMDTEQLAELAASKADEKRKASLANAYDSMRGGRR